jgi:glycerol-1-phosphate dehydrogenase [NAD(P)+]
LEKVEFKHALKSREECGCGYPHDRSLEAVFIGSLEEVVPKFGDFGLEPPYAVFYDETTYNVAGKRVKELLEARGLLVKAPTFWNAEELAVEVEDAGTILGVGGGTVIDVAKYAAYKTGASLASIPTAPSHDGIVSPIVSLFEKGGRKSILARSPKLAVIDLEIIKSAPRKLIISGYGDVLAKIVSIKDWQLGRKDVGEPYCPTAERLIFESLKTLTGSIMGSRGLEASLKPLIRALVNCGVAMMIAGSSRPASGSEHLISHYLDMRLGRRYPHGVQCAIGTLLMAAYHELKNPDWWIDERYRLKMIWEYFTRVGLPTSLEEIGLPKDLIINAIIEAWKIRPNRYTILHKYKPGVEDAKLILEESDLGNP